MSNALDELLSTLRKHGISKYKDKDIELSFSDRAYLKNPIIENDEETKSGTTATKLDENTDEDLFYSAQ